MSGRDQRKEKHQKKKQKKNSYKQEKTPNKNNRAERMKHLCAKVKGRSRGRWTHRSGERFNSNKLRNGTRAEPILKVKRNIALSVLFVVMNILTIPVGEIKA